MTTVKKLKQKLHRGSRLSCPEVEKLLKELGYTLVRQKGSHEQWVCQGRTFTLTRHQKEVPFYILDALIKLVPEEEK